MALAAVFMLWAGRDTSFFSDDLQYFGRANDAGVSVPFGLEYVLEPFNGHLQLVGKLTYELLFVTAGAEYFWFRLVEVLAYLVCVALFYELARVRVGVWAALAASVLLLFLGAGWEVMLWAFDLHTLFALAAGLAALLVLERGGRWADPIVCALLLFAIASIEIGFAFAIGIAVSILMRSDRRARIWVVAVPVVLYAIWSLWARKYGDGQVDPTYLSGLATSLPASLAATVASLTGLIDTNEGVGALLVGGLGPELVISIVALIAFIWRISVAPVPPTTWVLVSTLVSYWFFITLAHRQPDTSRYMLVDGLLLLLIVADLIGPVRIAGARLALLWALVAVALPLNLVKLFDGREYLVREASLSRSEYAMLELARDEVAPDYRPALSGAVLSFGLNPAYGLPAEDYFAAADRIGSLAMSLDELRDAPADVRLGADITLVGALGVELQASQAPAQPPVCDSVDGSEAEPAIVELPPGGALIGTDRGERVAVAVARFSAPEDRVDLGETEPGGWTAVPVTPDSAPDPWLLAIDGPARICPLEEQP